MNNAMPAAETVRNESTVDTCPRHIWMHEVLCASKVTVYQAAPHRARLNLWYNSGEPVWMAADSLRMAVGDDERAARNARASRDGDFTVARGLWFKFGPKGR